MFLHFRLLGCYESTPKPKKDMLCPQGLLNSLVGLEVSGLRLRNFTSFAIIQKPYFLRYTRIVVT